MNSALASLVCAIATWIDPSAGFAPAMQITFRGQVAPLARNGQPELAEKTFDLTWLAAEAAADQSRWYWVVQERGRGAWPWAQRYGQIVLGGGHLPMEATGPALLYDYGQGTSVIPLPLPLLAVDRPLNRDVKWQAGELEYEVVAAKTIEGRQTWQVDVRSNTGRKRTLWLDQQSPLLLAVSERVFMDRGTEFRLHLELVGTDMLADDEFVVAGRDFEALLALRDQLKRPLRSLQTPWTAAEMRLLARRLPELSASVRWPLLARLVEGAQRDLEAQQARYDALAALAAAQLGTSAPEFEIEGLDGAQLSRRQLDGDVTVLHFWDYRDQPLQEPYGQVGYLEFLYHRRHGAGLKVFGVAVDGRLSSPAERPTAVAGIRRLKKFMNLSYPVLLDSGELVKQFGDPRPLGGELPLFVVVGRDGKLLHYHAGLHAVDRQEGLKDLDAAAAAALDDPAAR